MSVTGLGMSATTSSVYLAIDHQIIDSNFCIYTPTTPRWVYILSQKFSTIDKIGMVSEVHLPFLIILSAIKFFLIAQNL